MATRVVLISSGWYHPSLFARAALRSALAAVPGVEIQRAARLEALTRLDLSRFAAIVLYIHHKQASEAALSALNRYVTEGGGLLAVHSAAASFKQQPKYYDILGGRFVGHGPVEQFTVEDSDARDPIFGQVDSFSVRDELYRHEWKPENRVHFHIGTEGEREPFVWTRAHGGGRVCYAAFGHTAESLKHPAVRAILRRGLLWACGMEPA